MQRNSDGDAIKSFEGVQSPLSSNALVSLPHHVQEVNNTFLDASFYWMLLFGTASSTLV